MPSQTRNGKSPWGIGGENFRVRFADVRIHLGPAGSPEGEWFEWSSESVSCSIGGQRGQSSSDNAVSSTSSTVNMNRGAQALALTAYDEFDKRFPAPPAPEPVPSPRFDL